MSLTSRILSAMAFGLALLVAASPVLASDPLRISGTGGSLGTFQRLSEPFAAATGIRLEVIPSLGSSGALKALQAGKLDLAITGRPINEKEMALGLRQEFSSRTPFVFVTTIQSPGGFTRAELGLKLQGPNPRWPDGEPMRLILRNVTESDYLILFPSFPGTEEAVAKLRRQSNLPVATADQENLDLAEQVPGALVATTLAQLVTENRSLRIIPVDGVMPDMETFQDGRYPYGKTFHYIASGRANDQVARFITFLRSPEGKSALRATGNLP